MANEQQQSGFEVYHIPQQSRRDKLRFTSLNSSYEDVDPTASTQISTTDFQHHSLGGGGGVGYLPLYDHSSLLPPDLLTCAPGSNNHGGFSLHHHQSHNRIYLPPSTSDHLDRLNPNTPSNNFVKEEGANYNYNFMGGFAANTRSISFIDPHGSLSTIPGIAAAAAQSSITSNTHHNNTDVPPFFLFPQQNKEIDHHHHQSTGSGNDLVLYKSEPLNRQQQQQQGGLSLSLSSNSASVIQQNTHTAGFARYPAPLGPFTGYASVLTGSKFLRPAQMLLQEICEMGVDGHEAAFGSNNENSPRAAGKIIGPPDLSLLDPPSTEGLRVFDEGGSGGVAGSSDDDQRDRRRKSRLISMLDEVVRRYKQYYHQFQAVIASFESVPGLGDAAPFANLALKAISKHFRILRNSITDQLQFTSKSPTDSMGQKEGNHHPRSNFGDKIALYSQRSMSSAARFPENHQPVWRPQRGLPERAVSVLRAWLFEHFLHPYPTDTDKMMLAKQTGLTRSQVSNWFINARVRLWKPMVEEIHALETNQQQHPQGHNQNPSSSSQAPNNHNSVDHHVPSASSFTSDLHHNHQSNTAGLMKPPQENITPIKRVRNDQEILDFSFVGSNQHQMSMHYSNHHHLSGLGPGTNGLVGGSSNVSLTLGLHQQNSSGAAGLSSDQFPHIGLAHPFGLGGGGDSNEQCAVPVGHGFEGQNQHFNRDVTGGSGHHLLHDFVG